MLGGDLAVMQAPGFDSLSFDSVSLFQDDLTPSEVDIGSGNFLNPCGLSSTIQAVVN